MLSETRAGYRHTVYACYLGYITQAIVNNFAPLLFLTFREQFGVGLARISVLVALNFGVQLLVDLLAVRFADRIGYRICIVAAHVFAAAGLGALALLPRLLPDPFAGLCAAVVIYAVGGGLIEVLVSPIVEAAPSENKAAAMSLLHSFYCWGHVFVILCSTLFFRLCGVERWPILACLWLLVPLANVFYFAAVPIRPPVAASEQLPLGALLRQKLFWILFLLMLCAGAAEQSMSQWASAFAEAGLGVSKTVGDLAGPCLFAALMGAARAIYGKCGARLPLKTAMACSCGLCIVCYLLACLTAHPALGLLGCALCGFSVGMLWPGTFSVAAQTCPAGGTAMYALLALAGDLGCGGGPTLVGRATALFGGELKPALLLGLLFPLLMLLLLPFAKRGEN
ncbi:MAG: MFS transporter [Clostridia bacterium]|nr:MFS transporter [Clostridia bacterium]